jgi:hypothetical protein
MMNSDMTAHGKGRDFGYVAGPEVFARVPAFVYTPPAAADALRGQALNISILAVWLGVAAALFATASRRLTVA